MTEPTDKEQYLNIADQCAATATSDLAASILVDGGNGTLRQLLNDAADAIRAGWATPQPTQAQAQRNHGQSLERLAQRGGLGASEAIDIMRGASWGSAKPCVENEHYLINQVRTWRAARKQGANHD